MSMRRRYVQRFETEPTEKEVNMEIKKAKKFFKGKYVNHYVKEGFHKKEHMWIVEVTIKTKV